jgi:hypothetical protein
MGAKVRVGDVGVRSRLASSPQPWNVLTLTLSHSHSLSLSHTLSLSLTLSISIPLSQKLVSNRRAPAPTGITFFEFFFQCSLERVKNNQARFLTYDEKLFNCHVYVMYAPSSVPAYKRTYVHMYIGRNLYLDLLYVCSQNWGACETFWAVDQLFRYPPFLTDPHSLFLFPVFSLTLICSTGAMHCQI